MNYFTPDLFEQLNSPNADEQIQAWTRWDQAERDYRSARSTWLADAPAGVRNLVKKFCGHDAEIVSQNRVGSSLLSLFVVGESRLWTLNYQIFTEPRTSPPRDEAKRWSPPGSRLWLYDELSQVASDRYRHEILLSDGATLDIDFSTVDVKSLPLEKPIASAPNYDFKVEFTLSGRELRAAFRQATLVPHQAVSRRKTASPRRSAKSAGKKAVK